MIGTILGIDPGKSGGIAVISADTDASVKPMPPSLPELWDEIRSIASLWRGHCFAILEQVHAMPGQGVSSTFKFGQGYGSIEMALVAAEIPFDRVQPTKWQRAVGVPSIQGESYTDRKRRLKGRAMELFPELRKDITLKTADALLLAHYGLMQRLKAESA